MAQPYARDVAAHFVDARFRGRVMAMSELSEPPDSRRVDVHDARAGPRRSVARHGFELVSARTAVTDFDDDAVVTGVFYKECEDIIKKLTGCAQTAVVGHKRRDGTPGKDFGGGYAFMVHSDCTPFYETYGSTMCEEIRPVTVGKHFAVFNLWRSTDLHGDIEMAPLCLCDPTTVSTGDMVPAESASPEGGKSIFYRLAYNPQQRWYVFPRMAPQETMVFKQYDTREPAPALRGFFHTAIEDPHSPAGPRRRRSIEVRVVAVFGGDADAAARKARFEAELGTPSDAFRALPVAAAVAANSKLYAQRYAAAPRGAKL